MNADSRPHTPVSTATSLPLSGVRILDLSSLLPGPLGTLMLAEAGAEVLKVERPGSGDEMRSYEPRFADTSANYAILNRGKRAIAADLKDPGQRDRILDLARTADVVVEQFRPGVADRLGLGFADVHAVNSRVVYCSISGYGARGNNAGKAGHDLNYQAESGILGVVCDGLGNPMLPVAVIADIAGGTYPAVVNILLALRMRDRTGQGTHIEVSMTHNLQLLSYGYYASHQVTGDWPRPNQELLTGGSPRYRIYRTADDRHVAVAALEEKFWVRLLELIGLDGRYRDEAGLEVETITALAERFLERPAAHWRELFEGEDVCATVVATFEEAEARGLVVDDSEHRIKGPNGAETMSALPTPIAAALRRPAGVVLYPALKTEASAAWTDS